MSFSSAPVATATTATARPPGVGGIRDVLLNGRSLGLTAVASGSLMVGGQGIADGCLYRCAGPQVGDDPVDHANLRKAVSIHVQPKSVIDFRSTRETFGKVHPLAHDTTAIKAVSKMLGFKYAVSMLRFKPWCPYKCNLWCKLFTCRKKAFLAQGVAAGRAETPEQVLYMCKWILGRGELIHEVLTFCSNRGEM